MKNITFGILALLFGALVTGCEDDDSDQSIVAWSQQGDAVQVFVTIKNTGYSTIDRYSIWMKVTCTDGTELFDRTVGYDLPNGQSLTHEIWIGLGGRDAAAVAIDHVEREHFN